MVARMSPDVRRTDCQSGYTADRTELTNHSNWVTSLAMTRPQRTNVRELTHWIDRDCCSETENIFGAKLKSHREIFFPPKYFSRQNFFPPNFLVTCRNSSGLMITWRQRRWLVSELHVRCHPVHQPECNARGGDGWAGTRPSYSLPYPKITLSLSKVIL